MLEVKLELMPKMSESVIENVIKTQCALEKSKQAERERYSFFCYLLSDHSVFSPQPLKMEIGDYSVW